MIKLLTQSDKEKVMSYIGRNEIETSFLYANVVEFGIDNNPDIRRCGDYYGFFEGEELRGILPFYNLGSCIPHYESHKAVPYFAEIMKKRDFQFLLGMKKVVKPLYEEIKDCRKVLEFDESSYFINKNFKPFTLGGVSFIDAAGSTDDKIVDFVLDGRIKGFNQEATREDILKTLSQRAKEEDFIIAQKDGKLVAQAGIQTYTPKVNQIGSVYTPEEERCKGYAKAVVSEICERITGRGKMPTLMVKKDNIPAVKAYNALGFEHYDDYLIIRLA
ncbi:GNAT family N-acetyltransferase [Lutispora thermophila]|uniref:N-acetyltransferase domain-containing protein n=1 Tax=Lutispora thermophila DSM 19022 TaxID=1122184 RepID=A0A1M6E3S7_9FIRM|nr:GNAT family N-acetyltransferase [Lutispora thermophila]SHI80146.1 hypothetical protein SAMN02745176_01401 [Lutispora thermophila DSM 19022]